MERTILGSPPPGFLRNVICEHPFANRSIVISHVPHILTASPLPGILRYRRLRTSFAKTKHWNQFDPFFLQKADTYKSSSTAIIRKPALFSPHVCSMLHSVERVLHFIRISPKDLAKSLKKLDGQEEELLKGYEEKGSALEVVF